MGIAISRWKKELRASELVKNPTRNYLWKTKNMDQFDSWLSDELVKLGVDADVYKDFVKGIIQDDDTEMDERIDAVEELVSSVMEEEGSVLDAFLKVLPTKWDAANATENAS